MRLAVFASGRGTNLKSILEACKRGEIQAEPALVVCNVPGAGAIDVALAADVEVLGLDHRDFPSRKSHEEAVLRGLEEHRIDLVALAGYMRLLSPFLVGRLHDPALGQSRILNIHPADPARYRGADGYGWAISSGQTETAVTVHYVDEGMDTGHVILQEKVPVLPGDTVESLKQRGLEIEHRVYPMAIQRVVERIEGGGPEHPVERGN